MKRISVSLVSIVLMFGLVETVGAFSGSGSGTEPDPYIITDVNQLQEMTYSLNAWYELGNDINAFDTESWNSGAGFVPVGDNAHPFVGHLQGNGLVISGLYIYRIGTDYVGLFAKIGSNATVDNVTLEDPNITGNNYCGSLAGYSDTSPANTHCSGGYVKGNDYVGGLVGQITSAVSDCNALFVEIQAHDYVGGLAGRSGSATNCVSSGLVQGNSYVGGLVGYLDGSMENCNSAASVTGTGGRCGGLVGHKQGSNSLTNCYATGSVSGSISDVGGLFGYCYDSTTITLCHSTGNVEGGAQAGGLIGNLQYNSTISNCYSTGNVTSEAGNVGGLIGYVYLYTSYQFTDCYAKGIVSGRGDNVGGLIGNGRVYYSLNISDCYASGNVYNSEGSNVGGLVGYFWYGTIQRSYSAADLVTGLTTVGGLVGYSEGGGSVSQCYSISDVNSLGDDAGGLVGFNNGTVTNCYAHGSIIGADYVGGFAGENSKNGDISKCYSMGSVTGNYNVGGFDGWNSGASSYNYWDNQTSGQTTSASGTGKTTTEMMQQATFEPDWDFEAVWGIDEGQDYPVLTVFTETCGDPWHPYPVGDFNHDCQVDFLDFAIFSAHWLECTDPNCQ